MLDRNAGSFTYSAIASSEAFYAWGSGSDGWLGVNRPEDTLILSNFASNVASPVDGVGGYFFGQRTGSG